MDFELSVEASSRPPLQAPPPEGILSRIFLNDKGMRGGWRLLIYAGKLIRQGIPARQACQTAVVWALTDETDVQRSLEEVVSTIFE